MCDRDMTENKIRQDFGSGRYFEIGILDPPEKAEHYYWLIGFDDDMPPMRILLEPQDFRSIRLFLERAFWKVVEPRG